MRKVILLLLLMPAVAFPQAIDRFLGDSTLKHASYSLYVADATSDNVILDMSSSASLTPASVLKLVTTAAALELLGPDYRFITRTGYTGNINRQGMLDGDIIIKGGGDPAFASPNFPAYYIEFPDGWVKEFRNLGIKKIKGRVITDDSYFDYLPVPSKWLWEDAGNYYGAGVYGASVYDNTFDIHFRTTSSGSPVTITGFVPEECRFELANRLVAEGTTDQGYVFAAPYSTSGWIAGSIPPGMEDFILSASIADPPLLISRIIHKKLQESGIRIRYDPSTVRLEKSGPVTSFKTVSESISPPLSEIIEVLNHESVNLYAEHLVKELGRKYRGSGSTAAGIEVISHFLDSTGVGHDGMFMVDGSGLSPVNSISAKSLASVLVYMINKSPYYDYFLNSLPEAGKEGTLKNWFKDEVFSTRLQAKSGSMTRVRSYAGYFTAISGRKMVFAFITNDFSGPSGNIARHYEEILREIIMEN